MPQPISGIVERVAFHAASQKLEPGKMISVTLPFMDKADRHEKCVNHHIMGLFASKWGIIDLIIYMQKRQASYAFTVTERFIETLGRAPSRGRREHDPIRG